jgi:DNA-directed RNA polymerase specialized sigma24 family protein
MAGSGRDGQFDEFARARAPWLRRVAYLLASDWHAADDLVQTTLVKLYAKWHRVGDLDNVDGYARTTLVNTFLAERRSPWSRVILHHTDPDAIARQSDLDSAALPPHPDGAHRWTRLG